MHSAAQNAFRETLMTGCLSVIIFRPLSLLTHSADSSVAYCGLHKSKDYVSYKSATLSNRQAESSALHRCRQAGTMRNRETVMTGCLSLIIFRPLSRCVNCVLRRTRQTHRSHTVATHIDKICVRQHCVARLQNHSNDTVAVYAHRPALTARQRHSSRCAGKLGIGAT